MPPRVKGEAPFANDMPLNEVFVAKLFVLVVRLPPAKMRLSPATGFPFGFQLKPLNPKTLVDQLLLVREPPSQVLTAAAVCPVRMMSRVEGGRMDVRTENNFIVVVEETTGGSRLGGLQEDGGLEDGAVGAESQTTLAGGNGRRFGWRNCIGNLEYRNQLI